VSDNDYWLRSKLFDATRESRRRLCYGSSHSWIRWSQTRLRFD
jgi:hypothetical protein